MHLQSPWGFIHVLQGTGRGKEICFQGCDVVCFPTHLGHCLLPLCREWNENHCPAGMWIPMCWTYHTAILLWGLPPPQRSSPPFNPCSPASAHGQGTQGPFAPYSLMSTLPLFSSDFSLLSSNWQALLSGWWSLTHLHLHLSRPKSFCSPKSQILKLRSQVEPSCLNVGKT